MESKPKYNDVASLWGKAHGYGIVEYVTTEEPGEIYHLSDKSFLGRKTGLPKFLLVEEGGTTHFSFDWDIKQINRLTELYLRNNHT